MKFSLPLPNLTTLLKRCKKIQAFQNLVLNLNSEDFRKSELEKTNVIKGKKSRAGTNHPVQ